MLQGWWQAFGWNWFGSAFATAAFADSLGQKISYDFSVFDIACVNSFTEMSHLYPMLCSS